MLRGCARRLSARPRTLVRCISTDKGDGSKIGKAKPRNIAVDRSGLLGNRGVREGRFFIDALKDVTKSSQSSSTSSSGGGGGSSSSTAGLILDDDSDLEAMAKHKEKLTPLAGDLRTLIQMKGPISLHEFVSQASNHFEHGYYQNTSDAANSKIGGSTSSSDFVTAPELSQLFGEMIALWCLQTWENLGRPPRLRLIELGPGKGTLMTDILRIAKTFPAFHGAIDVYFIELSDAMRKQQRAALVCADSDVRVDSVTKLSSCVSRHKHWQGKDIHWCRYISQVPTADASVPTLVVGQEFLDAFPVHHFVYTPRGWREKLVDVDNSADSQLYFRMVLSPNATPATKALLREGRTHISRASGDGSSNSGARDDPLDTTLLEEGDAVEIAPLALAVTEDVAGLVARTRGACLFVDYGEALTQADSLRAFRNHQQVHVLSQPGLCDVTADVDFASVSRAAAAKGVSVSAVVTQAEFLLRMGIVQRVQQLLDLPATTDEEASALVASMKCLVEEGQMGRKFKVLCLADRATAYPGFPDHTGANGVRLS